MLEIVKSLIDKDLPLYSNLANVSAAMNTMTDLNWCGFYIAKDDVLYVGPFQGEPACARIPFGKGVCGTSAIKKESIIVDDVHLFPGHIACSALSASEIVVPIIKNDKVVGLIDIDSPIKARFNVEIKEELENILLKRSKL